MNTVTIIQGKQYTITNVAAGTDGDIISLTSQTGKRYVGMKAYSGGYAFVAQGRRTRGFLPRMEWDGMTLREMAR